MVMKKTSPCSWRAAAGAICGLLLEEAQEEAGGRLSLVEGQELGGVFPCLCFAGLLGTCSWLWLEEAEKPAGELR